MAFHWFEESAKREDKSGEYALAICYEYGYGTFINRDKAKYWYEKAAKKGLVVAQKALERFEIENLGL